VRRRESSIPLRWAVFPYIPVRLDGSLLPFQIDTGAAVTAVRVLPKAKLVPLLSKPLSSYACSET